MRPYDPLATFKPHAPPAAAITSYGIFGVPVLVRAGVISQSGPGILNADGVTVRAGVLVWGKCSELLGVLS